MAFPSFAEPVRVAIFHADLSRKGPGLLLRDIQRKTDAVKCVAQILIEAAPDVVLLSDFDYDYDGHAARAFSSHLQDQGIDLPFQYSLPSNAGVQTGLDLNSNGRLGDPQDAHGFGYFAGQGGMVILSRWPFDVGKAQNLSSLLWHDAPETLMTEEDPGVGVLKLSSDGHWVVPVLAPNPFSVFAFHATAPVFDGPEDRNGRRNHDQIGIWLSYLDGALSFEPLNLPFVILGDANLDPEKGEGRKDALVRLLTDHRVQDPAPVGALGRNTVDWPDPKPGNLRVSYVLPSASISFLGSAVHEPEKPCSKEELPAHRLVWVDLAFTPEPVPYERP